MRPILIFFFLLGQLLSAQSNVDKLIDSLSVTTSEKDRALIAIQVSEKLKDTDWKRASHYIEYTESQLKSINGDEFYASINERIATIYNEKDALDIALSYYLKAYEVYSLSETEKKYELETGLAIIYARLNNTERALYYFNKALKYYSKKNDKPHMAKAFNNMGKLYYANNIADSAVYYFNKSLELTKTIDDSELKIVLYNNLGILRSSQKNFSEAKNYFNKALVLAEQKEYKDRMAWIYNSLSKLYLAKKEPDSSLIYAQKAESLLMNHKFSFENLSNLENLYKSYLKKEDSKSAAKYFYSYNAVRDSLNIEMKAVNVQKLNLEQQYKENEELRTLKENRKQFIYLIFGFGLIIILLILAILLSRYRNKLTKAQLEKDLFEAKRKELDANLELKNKELMTKSMMEIQRTEIIDQIMTDLKKLRLQSPKKESQQAIDTIIKQLEKDNTDDEVWKEFELHHGQVYETFYKILEEKHPELTYRDKRLCALLKLNLTTKEISRITGQSVKSLENARTRLRKKLNLTNTDQNLTNYLAGLE